MTDLELESIWATALVDIMAVWWGVDRWVTFAQLHRVMRGDA